MKKTIAFLFAALASTAVFAEESVADAMTTKVYTFTISEGAKYADGTALLQGERVMVVGTKRGLTFTGIDAAGNPLDENTSVIVTPMVVELGKKFEVQVSADLDLTLRALVLDSRAYLNVPAEVLLESAKQSKVVVMGANPAVNPEAKFVIGKEIAAYSVIICNEEGSQSPIVQTSGAPKFFHDIFLPSITEIKVLAEGGAELTLTGLGRFKPAKLMWSDTVAALADKAAGGLLSAGESPAVDSVDGLKANAGAEVRIRIPGVENGRTEKVSADATFFKLEASDAE